MVASLSNPSLLVSVQVDSAYANEQKYLDIVVNHVGRPYVTVRPDPSEFPRTVIEMVRALDYPVGSLAAYSQFLLSRTIAERGFRLSLNGLGADEYLAGYVRHLILIAGNESLEMSGDFTSYRPLMEKMALLPGGTQSWERYYGLVSRSEPALHAALAKKKMRRLFAKSRKLVGQVTYADFAISLPQLLRIDDRINMHFGIEGRSPFMDYRLIEYAMGLDDRMIVRPVDGHKILSKYILRQAGQGDIPGVVLDRRDKVGFPSPVIGWLRGQYSHSIERSCAVLKHAAPVLFKSLRSRNQEDAFSRREWLVLQWAIWHLMFVFQLPDNEIERVLFSASADSSWQISVGPSSIQ